MSTEEVVDIVMRCPDYPLIFHFSGLFRKFEMDKAARLLRQLEIGFEIDLDGKTFGMRGVASIRVRPHATRLSVSSRPAA
jgi:hypothetical protein